MRILCLHGMGTSAKIFAAQMSRVLPELQAQGHEFVFIDGLKECDTTDDIKLVYPPKYLAYYPIASEDLVLDAQDYVREVIEDEGPFDGVMGFSQGGALAASLIIEHNKIEQWKPLFRFAIFVCATLPFNQADPNGLESWKQAKSGRILYPGEFAGEVDSKDPLGFPDDLSGTILGRYHPLKNTDAKISIPTVHVIGRSDAYAQQCELLSSMCDPNQMDVIEHAEGHRLPSDGKTNKLIAKSISAMIKGVSFTN